MKAVRATMRRLNEHGERMTAREVASLRAKLGRHARDNCARYGCDACPFAAGCIVGMQADRIAANTCPVFVRYVLPSDPALQREYEDALPVGHPAKPTPEEVAGLKRCAADGCGKRFEPTSNRAKYCEGCREKIRAEQAKKRMREKRLSDALKQR